jgi:flavin-dependent dehydrogenase
MRYDAIVVGARCAGASTAMLLARRGLRVLVVERARYGSDTLSTLALMRGAVLQLLRWGVLERVRDTGAPAIRSTSFQYGDETIELAIKARDGVEALYAPRRKVLDALLEDAAVAAGAEIWHGVRLIDVMRTKEGRVSGAIIEDSGRGLLQVEAEIVIGADGARSTLARLVGAEMTRTGRHASGVVYGFWSGLGQRGNAWSFSSSNGGNGGSGAGAIATHDGETLVFASVSAGRFHAEIQRDIERGFQRVLRECAPELARRVAGATRLGVLRGFAGQVGFFRKCYGPGWALVGDAGYFKDPITAHGMTDALRDAELLARGVVHGTDRALADYQEARDALSLPLFRITDEIASYAWDFDRVKALHVEMSAEMNREVKALVELERVPWSPKRGDSAFGDLAGGVRVTERRWAIAKPAC